MKIVTLSITIFLCQHLLSQDTTRIFIEAGKRFDDVVTPAIMFKYKEFRPGRVLFKDGSMNDSRMNYNLFNGEIMFIAAGGDTLAIAEEQMRNIKRVTIDSHSYVYYKGYLEVIRENAMGTLARKQQYFVLSREKIGGYNFAAPTSSIDSYNSFSDRQNNRHDLHVRENINLQLHTIYYVADVYNHFLPLNKKNLEKIFFKKRNELEKYLSDNQVDFRNEQQVIVMFESLMGKP